MKYITATVKVLSFTPTPRNKNLNFELEVVVLKNPQDQHSSDITTSVAKHAAKMFKESLVL